MTSRVPLHFIYKRKGDSLICDFGTGQQAFSNGVKAFWLKGSSIQHATVKIGEQILSECQVDPDFNDVQKLPLSLNEAVLPLHTLKYHRVFLELSFSCEPGEVEIWCEECESRHIEHAGRLDVYVVSLDNSHNVWRFLSGLAAKRFETGHESREKLAEAEARVCKHEQIISELRDRYSGSSLFQAVREALKI